MPTNYESIFGGIFRGLSNNKNSGGTNPQIPTQQNNPLVYAWIGQQTNDLRQPIQKEQAQNSTLGLASSAGTLVPYSQPVPTDIPTRTALTTPGTDVSLAVFASPIGGLTQPVPLAVPTSNNGGGFGDYDMQPLNGSHFSRYFSNQLGNYNLLAKPNPANVLTAVQEQANSNSDGSANVWQGAYQTFAMMAKPYDPNASNHWQGLRQS